MNEFEVQPTPNGQSQPTATLTPPTNDNGHSDQLVAEGGTNIGEIDRIRDIIFGGQQRDMERRFKTLERRAETLTNDLHDLAARHDQSQIDLDNGLKLLEEQLHQEVQTLDSRLQTSRRETQERLSVLERQMTDRLARLERSLTEQLDSMGEDKLNRLDMGDLLVEAGMRLRKEKLIQG